MDRKDLKIQALLEKVASLTQNYENQIADLRVDFTLVSQERDNLQSRVEELEKPDVPQDAEAPEAHDEN